MENASHHGSSVDLLVEGMSCGHCEKRVRSALEALPGVSAAAVDLAAGRASASFDPDRLSAAEVAAAVSAAGYPARVQG